MEDRKDTGPASERGQFEEACRWAKKALELVPEKGMAEIRSRLMLYQSEKPYRLSAKR